MVNPEHIWLMPKPVQDFEQRFLLTSLLHLGVRPAWIDSWSAIGDAFRNLMAI